MSKITTVLFDLDGVLVDAKEWHYEALNQALRHFGHEINRAEHLTTLDGLPTKKKLEYLTLTKNLPERLHQLINDLKQVYTRQLIAMNCFPRFQTEYALARLRKENYRLGVCSNAVRETLDLMLENSQLSEYVEITLSNGDCKKPKPDPEIYLEAMRRLEVKPNECLIVEDNQHGIEAARASGAKVLVVRTVEEVSYWNVMDFIARDEEKSCSRS